MIQQQVYILNTFLMVGDAMCVMASAYAAYYSSLFFVEGFLPFSSYMFVIIILVLMFFNTYFMGRFGLYADSPHPTIISMVRAILQSVFGDFILLAAAVYLLDLTELSHSFLWLYFIYTFLFILLTRLAVHLYVTKVSGNGFNARKILVVGEEKRGKIVTKVLENQLSWGHSIVGHITVGSLEEGEGLGDKLEELTHQLKSQTIDEVLFVLTKFSNVDLHECLNICRKIGVSARILPSLWSPEGPLLSVEVCQNIPFLNLRADNFDAYGLLCKRALDVVGSFVGIAIFLLIYPFVGLAIKIDSPGPILFTQLRKGQHGRTFRLYKFRTMFQNAEEMKQQLLEKNEMDGHMFKMTDDPRITRLGRFLRTTSIDEVPQFINVLKGEMSLVGTRPPTLAEVDKYQPEHLKRISAKPGITGLWQISGRNKIKDFNKVVELDSLYLNNWSFWEDVLILFKTLWVVLQRKGAT